MGIIRSLSNAPPARQSNQSSQHDFTPFLSAPAVVHRAKANGGAVRPLHIPRTHIPSPLARDISPDQLLGLKTSLVGSGPENSSRTGNGREIWLSWKRAWDLWNNHYIPGRENPLWIKKEFERMQRAEQQVNYFGDHLRTVQDMEMMDVDDDAFTRDLAIADGGFQAIKDFPEFKEPPPFDPDIGDDGIVWDDPISNSVWRPRRVREETLDIDVDLDQDDFLRDSQLEKDRGVDCGRLPYPVLRPLLEYVQLANGAFIKKKVWDGVTGTVFNIPTAPLEPAEDPEDERLDTVKQMYGNSFWQRNTQSVNKDIFPLDIRRVERVPQSSASRPTTHLLENDCDDLVRDRCAKNDPLPFKHRATSVDDPWYVTEEQQVLIDYPPRRYPYPEQVYESKLIPVDDTIFREELERDQLNHTSYFVTNLHHRTLVINGVEIRKGEVAGPLPQFAVIECPGGQIAFWFGSYGRHFLAGNQEHSYPKWQALQNREGWMYTGLSAGHVWRAKIKDRLERIKTGDRENDDEQWEVWLRSIGPEKPEPITSVTYQLPLPGSVPGNLLPLPADITGPHVLFPSEREELGWIIAQRELYRKPAAHIGTGILASIESYFLGSKNRADYLPHKELTLDYVIEVWNDRGEAVEKLQQQLVESIRNRERMEAEAEAKRLESFGLPNEKRDELLLIEPRSTQLKDLEFMEEGLVSGFRREPEQQVQHGLTNESIHRLQSAWDEYTTRRREEQRKRAAEGVTPHEGSRKERKVTFSGLDQTQANILKKWTNTYKSAKKSQQLDEDKIIQKEIQKVALQEYAKQLLEEAVLDNPPEEETKRRPKIILHHKPKPETTINISPPIMEYLDELELELFGDSPQSNLSENEDEELKQALAMSTKTHRNTLEQNFIKAAAGAHVSVSKYLALQGFSNMAEYLDVAVLSPPKPTKVTLDPKREAFNEFQSTLRQAYEDGSRAQARLENMTWEEFTALKYALSPNEWLDLMMRQTWVTVDDIPGEITARTSLKMEEALRSKWSRLCDMVIEASDFEAQTKATSLPIEAHVDVEKKTFAMI